MRKRVHLNQVSRVETCFRFVVRALARIWVRRRYELKLALRTSEKIRAVPAWAGAAGCLLTFSSARAADVRLMLPLEGNYRAGRYMPVRVAASGVSGGSLTILARGAIPLVVDAPAGAVDTVAPWLAVRDSLGEVRWSDQFDQHPVDIRLRALGEGEKLVALCGMDAAAARQLFPEQTVITVRLDPSQPLPEPLCAWRRSML